MKTKTIMAFCTALVIFLAGCNTAGTPSLVGFQDETPTINVEDLNGITERFVLPLNPNGRILLSSWASPEEIKASDLIQFCAYNNLLNKEVNPSGDTIMSGAQYVDHSGPANDVEEAIHQYFDVSAEHLRTAPEYENEETGFYFIGDGFGGGGAVRVLDAKLDNGVLTVQVGIFGPDDDEKPTKTGNLQITLTDEGYKYTSYVMEP